MLFPNGELQTTAAVNTFSSLLAWNDTFIGEMFTEDELDTHIRSERVRDTETEVQREREQRWLR